MNRREFLRGTAAVACALATKPFAATPRPTTIPVEKKYVTCFYQFTGEVVQTLARKGGLPNGEQFLHIFSQSHPGNRAHADTAKEVHAAGASFKYALAFDLHKYKGILSASDEQIKDWCKEFRGFCFDSNADYWAFNEMPTTGGKNASVQNHVAKILRNLRDPGDGKILPGIFYSTEQGVDPDNWRQTDKEFWPAVDETCDLVVGEHYHSTDFVFSHKSPKDYAAHLFDMAKYLDDAGQRPQRDIARNKYAVLHSSYYGPSEGGWHGPTTKESEPAVRKYLKFCIDATRASPYGKNRISFGPLNTATFDIRIVPILADLLGDDARAWLKQNDAKDS